MYNYRAITASNTLNELINVVSRAYTPKKTVQNTIKSAKMCKNDLKLDVLPPDLQDIVLSFAFNLKKRQVVQSLTVFLEIIEMELPFFFFRQRIWSWYYKKYLPNPIFVFLPIEFYDGRYASLFDDDSMYCLLIGLDFRRKNVKCFGSRDIWLDRIVCNWQAVEPLAAFYKMLLRCETPIMKKRGPLVSSFV